MSYKKKILDKVLEKRGYLLTYHKMIGEWDPKLLESYDSFYENLTLEERTLTLKNRELVWAALQVAADEEHGHIHMKRAKKVFESEGISVQPYPVDFKSSRSFISLLRNPLKWMPDSYYLYQSSSAIREIIGRIIYRAW